MGLKTDFIVLEIDFRDGIQFLKHETCCRWLREESGLTEDDLLSILDIQVNVNPDDCVMIEFRKSTDIEEIVNRIRNKEIRDDVDTPVGLLKNIKICDVSPTTEVYLVTIDLKNPKSTGFSYCRGLFEEEGIVLGMDKQEHLFSTTLSVYMVVPCGSEWLNEKGKEIVFEDGTEASLKKDSIMPISDLN